MAILYRKKFKKKGHCIVLFAAYFLNFLLNFWKLNMDIILLSKSNSMTQSACQCQKPFRNHSLQKMAIIHHENLKKRLNRHHFYIAYLLNFLLDFLKLKMKTILLSKPDLMVVSAYLWSKPFRNNHMLKAAIIHYENSKKDDRASFINYRVIHLDC